MSVWKDSDDTNDGGPVDLAAVTRDDRFVDDLAAGRPTPVDNDAEYQLAAMITEWRMDALAAPVPAEPTADQVASAIAVRDRRGSMSRRLRLVSGAAAILAVFGAALMVLSEGAEPGDPLWSVKSVVFAEQAKQTQARINVESNLQQAEAAYQAGDEVRGRSYIERAEQELEPVADSEIAQDLRIRISELREAEDPTSEPDDPRDLSVLTDEPTRPTAEPDTSESSKPSKPSGSSSKSSTASESSSKPSDKSSESPRPSRSHSDTPKPRPTTTPASTSVEITEAETGEVDG